MPTIADNKTTNGAGAGSYTSIMTGLSISITYYVRAYATNSEGTGYGMSMSFINTICKTCAQKKYDSSGNLISEGSDAEYCDSELLKIESTPNVVILGVTYKWICR